MLPKAVRDKLRLERGDTLALEQSGDRVTLSPVRRRATMRKELGVWVFDDGGEPISASTVQETVDSVRDERARRSLGLPGE